MEQESGNGQFPNGMWPVMVTPFTKAGEVDCQALEQLVEWYISQGAAGLFADCQSSEIFQLSLEERVKIAKLVKSQAGPRVPVIASGHVSYGMEDQVQELNQIAATGIDALILISNRLARQEEPDQVFLDRMEELARNLPKSLPLGFYECPYPYKRILTPAIVEKCADSGRFYFLKDTSCSLEHMGMKLEIAKGSPMKLYNANTATLLGSLKMGGAGYSGVMANYQPQLYRWLLDNWKREPGQAELVQDVLTMCSYIELKNYPASAKYYLKLENLPINGITRIEGNRPLSDTEVLELSQLKRLTDMLLDRCKKVGRLGQAAGCF